MLTPTATKNYPPIHKRNGQQLKVAYIMSRFPKITETFVLYEMLAVEKQGVQIELYPLRREKTAVMHPEAVDFVERANFLPHFSWQILRSHLHFLRRKPRAYLGALGTLLKANWGSRRYFTGALGLFPKTVHFAKLMEDEGIDHLHAHFASHPAAAAFVIHRLVDIPYSFTGHGSDLNRDQHMLCEKVAEASFVVPISNFFQEMIIARCGEQYRHKINVIHCGVNTDIFQPVAAEEKEKSDDALAIFCVGTLHEVKGQTYLIEACRLLRERGIPFHCHFLGDGPDESMLKAQTAQAGLIDQIHFHGRLQHQEIVELLKGADVLVAPSVPTQDGRKEGIPVVLMEAMASGLPVISTNMSGIPELVEDGLNGFLTKPGDAQAVADDLQRLYLDPDLRQQLAQAGRDRVVDEFDLNRNAYTLASYFAKESQ